MKGPRLVLADPGDAAVLGICALQLQGLSALGVRALAVVELGRHRDPLALGSRAACGGTSPSSPFRAHSGRAASLQASSGAAPGGLWAAPGLAPRS